MSALMKCFEIHDTSRYEVYRLNLHKNNLTKFKSILIYQNEF